MKKIRSIIAVMTAAVAVCVFAGCGTSFDRTTFVLDRDGSVKQYIIDDADEDTTITELKNYVTASVRDYLAGSEDETVRMEKCDINGGKVDIELQYSSCADYAAFNNVVCFEGTLSDAQDAGYDLDQAYLDITSEEGQIRVLILNEVTDVVLPGTLLAYSDNVQLNENGTLSTIPDTDESVPEEFRTINFENAYFVYSVK